jgi:ABC-2 type transport system permease protein
VFFYLLGALYDDRRDRSVLFWKSLPLSDTQTVLSKVVAAAFIAPALAIAAMIALHIGFLILLSLYALLHGINPLPLLWSPLHLIGLWLKLVALIPLNAIWALPCIGWLLLCSSFARSKPFLWAVAVPVIAGIMVGWVNLMSQLSLPNIWFWHKIVGRCLLSVFPGSWVNAEAFKDLARSHGNPGDMLGAVLSLDSVKALLTSADLWVGAAAGVAMIAAAIYFRRKRTEAYA